MANNVSLSYPSSFYHQFFDRNGKPLASGKLYTYIAGSSTPVVTYKTIGGGTESANMNTNPIILNMSGMAELVISTNIAYKFILFDKNNVKIDEWDNVTAGVSEGGSSSNVYVEGTSGEIDVEEESAGPIRRFIVSLSDSVKNAISNLSSSVNDIIDALYNKKDKQEPVSLSGSTTKVPTSFAQNANGELDIEFDDIAFPDWTTAINNAVANCEQTSNKKNSVTGYESSTSAYPSIKAVVDFVNNVLQNLGGKLITDNGNPFSDSNDLPSTTPYQGVTISDKDYAYVQGTGFAERWSTSVSGSDVTWVQEYSINIPVFTPAQQAAIDSGATATKIGNYDSHISDTTIHVTSTEKNTWNAKQNAISDLAEIRSGAAAGATALQPNGNGSNVTSTFTAASSRTNISSGEKLSTIFGKIAKWFADLKSVAFSGSYSDLSNKPTIGSGTLTIQKNGTNVATFGANQNGNATANIIVPTNTSELTNDSDFLKTNGNGSNLTSTFTKNANDTSGMTSGGKLSELFKAISDFFASLKAVAFSGSYDDLSHKPTIPAAANNGILTIKQNGTSKGTFSANQSSNTEINVTDTTYESKSAVSGGTADSLVTTGEKYNWNGKQNALPTSGTALDKYAVNISGFAGMLNAESIGYTAIDLNTLVGDSFRLYKWINSNRENVSNRPTDSGGGLLVVMSYSVNRILQVVLNSSSELFARLCNNDNSTWTSWINLRDASWINSGTFPDSRIASASVWNNKAEKNGDYRTQGLQAAYATQSGFANESTYAGKIGSSERHPQIGSQTRPIWVDSDGNVQECSDPSGWSVGVASYADLARYVYSTEFGGCDKPSFVKTTGQTNVAELGSAFDIPHVVTRWHEELFYPSTTGFGIIHRTDKFSDPTTKSMDLAIEIATDNTSFNLTLDGSSLTPWYGGQVWGTIKWDSQSGSNLNSAISRIGISNIADSNTILATRNISTSNQQDIQGHALFAICTGDFLHRYVVDMEISLIKPQAGSSVSYVSVVSKCHSVSPVY